MGGNNCTIADPELSIAHRTQIHETPARAQNNDLNRRRRANNCAAITTRNAIPIRNGQTNNRIFFSPFYPIPNEVQPAGRSAPIYFTPIGCRLRRHEKRGRSDTQKRRFYRTVNGIALCKSKCLCRIIIMAESTVTERDTNRILFMYTLGLDNCG